MSNKEQNIIKGLRDLENYLRDIGLNTSRPTIMKYIDAGLPCWNFQGTYHFHKDNVDRFFKVMTSKSIKNPPEEGEDIGEKP